MEDIQDLTGRMMDKYDMSENRIKDVVAVIPALDPDDGLISCVREMKANGFRTILVIDDGSSHPHRAVFDSLDGMAVVLHHDKNHGKGAALKTGLKWVKDNEPDATGVITLDSDGQHKVKDCVKIAGMLRDEKMILLGARDFDQSHIPFRSRAGNRITMFVFRMLFGKKLPDTQTGLRAFPMQLIDSMSSIEGDRYEYEMNVLIECAKADIPIISVPIDTVYDKNNESSHFRPVSDSARIYTSIFGNFVKFTGSSLLCMLVDQGLFNLMNLVMFSNGTAKKTIFIYLSTAIARVLSAGLNFTLNRKLVFKGNNNIREAVFRYIMTCITIMVLSATGTWLLSISGANTTIAKLIVDGLLYLLSYRMQKKWVFRMKEQ